MKKIIYLNLTAIHIIFSNFLAEIRCFILSRRQDSCGSGILTSIRAQIPVTRRVDLSSGPYRQGQTRAACSCHLHYTRLFSGPDSPQPDIRQLGPALVQESPSHLPCILSLRLTASTKFPPSICEKLTGFRR